ncbi:MAG: TRAP transporter substrate-binding protein DctP, partial [Pseudomonadota bacterium]
AAFDISPIPLPISDVLGGLQTGLIDSVGSPPIGTIALQWHTQVQYGLELPLIYVYGTLAMADRAFGKLSEDHQAIVRKHLSAAVQAVDRSARNDHLSARQAITNQGIDWLTPNDEEMAQWLDLADKAREATVADGYISADLYEQVEMLLQQHREGG